MHNTGRRMCIFILPMCYFYLDREFCVISISKPGEERQRALLYNHRALKLYPSLNTNNGEILEGAFVVSRYFAPSHRSINITGSKHMIYDMFCLGHFCASLQPSLYARHHLSQTSNKTSHLMLFS